MAKNKSYIGISFIVLIFGIWAVPKIVSRVKNHEVVKGERLGNVVPGNEIDTNLLLIRKAPRFELTDQHNEKISDKDYLGKVYVLEFFFSTCPTICPVMNAHMMEIQNTFFGKPNFGIASITINPENDTPEVLKKHAEQLGVKSENWHFLTGDKDYIYDIANKGFNLYANGNTKANGGFEHSGFFALIDKKGNLRCRKDDYGNAIMYYDGTLQTGVEAIKQDIKILLNE